MANSGYLNTTAYDSRYIEFSWSIKNQDVANNQTTIYWKLTAKGSGQYSEYKAAPFKVQLDGTQIYYSATRITTKNGTLIANGERTLTHNANGTRSFAVTVDAAIYKANYNVSGSASFTLDTIGRAPYFTSATWANDEADIKIGYSNPAGSLASGLRVDLYGNVGYIIASRTLSTTGTSATITLTDAERQEAWDIYNSRGTTETTFYLDIVATISGETVKNTRTISSKLINCTPGADIEYYFDSKTNEVTGKTNAFPIINYTTLYYTIKPTLKKGATFKHYTFNQPYNTSPSTSLTANIRMLSNSLRYAVYDSRGQYIEKELHFSNYCNYTRLTCNQEVKTDWLDETTLVAKVAITGTYYDGSIGSKQNNLMLYCRYCSEDEEASGVDINLLPWTYIGTAQTKKDGTYQTIHTINGLDYTKGYKIQCSAQDELMSVHANIYNSKLLPIFDWGETDFNLNVPLYIMNKEQDYIVAQGTNNGWTYRKWNSGIGECWKTISYTTTVTGAWGNMYQSGYIERQDYPFAFIEKPVENVSCVAGGGGGIICPADAANGGTNGGYASAVYIIVRPTAATTYQTYYINYQVKGKWR